MFLIIVNIEDDVKILEEETLDEETLLKNNEILIV